MPVPQNTLSVFNNMMKVHQPYQAMEDYVKRSDFFLKKVGVEKGFIGGELTIPFVTAGHSNVRAGKLTPIGEITRGAQEPGKLLEENLAEFWGTISFHEKDIKKYKSAEKAFTTLFPSKVNELMEIMKEIVSVGFLQDGSITNIKSFATDGTDGVVVVDRPERLNIRQRLDLYDGATLIQAYVKIIDMETDRVTFADAEEGGAVVDLSALVIANKPKVFVLDHKNNVYDTLKSMLLPASKGGSANLHGVPKLSSPILQAHYQNCSGWSASTILSNVFDLFKKVKQKGKVKEISVVVPYFVFNDLVLKAQESKRYTSSDTEAGYGYDKVKITGAGGSLEVYGVFDLTDTGYIIDWEMLKLASPEMFSSNRELGTEPWERVRTEDGYVYIMDICFRGGLVLRKASGCAVLDELNYGA